MILTKVVFTSTIWSSLIRSNPLGPLQTILFILKRTEWRRGSCMINIGPDSIFHLCCPIVLVCYSDCTWVFMCAILKFFIYFRPVSIPYTYKRVAWVELDTIRLVWQCGFYFVLIASAQRPQPVMWSRPPQSLRSLVGNCPLSKRFLDISSSR